MAAYQAGLLDLEGVKAVQLAMLAHCELMGDRVAILDPPPGYNAQQIGEWRMEKAGYDSKYATLYWPWIKVFDPVERQGHLRPAERPHGRHLGPHRRQRRGVHKAPANEVVRGVICTGDATSRRGEHDLLNPNGINCIRAFAGRGIRIWGARTLVERSGVAVPQRAAALQLHRGVGARGHPVGRVRAERHRRSGSGSAARSPRSCSEFGGTARCSAPHPKRRSTSSATPRPTRPMSVDAGQARRARSGSRR